ncbi:hypothetical protein ERJ70_07965 [Sediminibacillus dalangtanensis]|uniref:Transposase IS204/IS1001/IS1096/IS1165 DDE domain-containing protein n=1 Tax=Sediminibacillus dalangtanensis TaxID=2729421 RepID=A0ABX7VRV1_9BACI|nr:hypothetical protein ERJ70_07965 [Sediminibacillus dalangtanensis]
MVLSKSFNRQSVRYLGVPLIIADRFHFMRQIYLVVNAVRPEVQREVDKKTRIHTKRGKKLLWKSPSKLSEGRQKVEKDWINACNGCALLT